MSPVSQLAQEDPMKAGMIIMLNGASSSGKSTILHALQDLFDEPYLDAGLDKFLWMLPTRYLDRPLWDEVLGLATRAGDLGHHLVGGMHRAIEGLSRSGNNVIADHVLVERSWLLQSALLFSDLPAYLVGVRCPLEVLEARERQRRTRTIGQAKAQHELVHTDLTYDFEVDTSVSSAQACAQQIKERVEQGGPPRVFKLLRERVAG